MFHREKINRVGIGVAMSIHVSTRKLCEIAGIKHGRFNWLISHGAFPWVPACENKHSRSWDVDDVLTISIYQQLVSERAPVQRAAEITNAVTAALRAKPQCSMVGFVDDAKGPRAVAFADWHELVDWDVDEKNFRTMAIFAIAPRRQSIQASLSEAA